MDRMDLANKIDEFIKEEKLIAQGDSIVVGVSRWTRFNLFVKYIRKNTKKRTRL